tara:strand:+ start:834 stop:1661 length:828 start_codon:yes stop_codon:yes gene_type:complete
MSEEEFTVNSGSDEVDEVVDDEANDDVNDENLYTKELLCFSYACSSKPELSSRLNYSNKICLPESILYEIKERDVEFPLFFRVKNKITQYGSVCGVEEFTSPPGVCHLPYQIMTDICVEEGTQVELELVIPPKGDFVKLRFHTSEFANLTNPKIIMEKIMSKDYPVLTCGQTIVLNYTDLNKIYRVDILETKPTEVIKIIDTNLNVDFAPTLDSKNNENQEENVVIRPDNVQPIIPSTVYNGPIINNREELLKKYKQWSNGFIPFSGRGYRLGNK